ncbi:MAG: hypothetical protein RMK57_03065 [Bryobacterales bacterium]|nr:hypothetical protein [Bryobacteraceae bacterium]MDW8353488.1 hypothetical protein [Bryobacterales bacterium]
MTEQDLKQIREVVREEVAAAEQRLDQRWEQGLRQELAATEQRLRQELAATEQRLATATAANLSDLRSELLQQIHHVRRELENTVLHLDRIDTRLAALALEVSGISKTREAAERLNREILSTQSSQQRTIDELSRFVRDLSARVAKLEEALHQ